MFCKVLTYILSYIVLKNNTLNIIKYCNTNNNISSINFDYKIKYDSITLHP